MLTSALVVPSPAGAGSDFVDLTTGSGRVWFVGEPGVREFDSRNGRLVAKLQLRQATYPLSVTLAGGGAWVAGVENGYVSGSLTRIDVRTKRMRVVWRTPNGSVQYVASGRAGVWALLGSTAGNRVARFSLDGRLARVWRIPGAGRIAADASGCWISSDRARPSR